MITNPDGTKDCYGTTETLLKKGVLLRFTDLDRARLADDGYSVLYIQDQKLYEFPISDESLLEDADNTTVSFKVQLELMEDYLSQTPQAHYLGYLHSLAPLPLTKFKPEQFAIADQSLNLTYETVVQKLG